MAKKRSWKKLF